MPENEGTAGDLLNERQVSDMTGLSISRLCHRRAHGTSIPFITLGAGLYANIRYRLEDVEAFLAVNPKVPPRAGNDKPSAKVQPGERAPARIVKKPAPPIQEKAATPLTVSCEEAARRHQGVTAHTIRKMCLRGQYMARRYGGPSRVPVKQAAMVLFAVKLGKAWHIPVSELDRVFLGKQE